MLNKIIKQQKSGVYKTILIFPMQNANINLFFYLKSKL